MTKSNFRRCISGEHEAVYQEFPKVRDSAIFEDACAVSAETIDRVIQNLSILHDNLLSLRYQFQEAEKAFVLRDSSHLSPIPEIEKRFGTLPLLARTWFEKIESVSFYQHREHWHFDASKPPDGFQSIFGLGGSATSLYVE
ncbi:MAG: hypothetical protein CMJ78_25425 [Planctomycetaceae bacterium]|nr:hypothetical protein [Planctomycetaceae bacterium]